METYQKEISIFVGRSFDTEKQEFNDNTTIKKTVTFKELNRLDKSQAPIHWGIMDLMSSSKIDEANQTSKINFDMLRELIYLYIDKMLVIEKDSEFTEQNKKEFIQDSGALMQFGFWLLKEKISPFFSVLMSV